MGAQPAENPLRQNHAPHPAQDRRERDRQSGRHLHAGRSGRGERSGEEPRGLRGRKGKATFCEQKVAPKTLPIWAVRVSSPLAQMSPKIFAPLFKKAAAFLQPRAKKPTSRSASVTIGSAMAAARRAPACRIWSSVAGSVR